MNSAALVQLALNELSCNQKELGIRLGVSQAQISKWKKGEHLSSEMEDKLRQLSNIGDQVPSFVLAAGSKTEAEKWSRLISHLATDAYENAETGYNTYPLSDEEGLRDLLCASTFDVLKELGVTIPERFPSELDVDYDVDSDEDIEALCALFEANPYVKAIRAIFNALNDVYGFYAAYIFELMYDEDLDLMETAAENIEPCLINLAAAKVELDLTFAPNSIGFRSKTKKEFQRWIEIVKDKAFRAGTPLGAELLDLVYESHDALGHDAEAESLGFNKTRIHPDIYMNELLTGMRVIHQVLPAILKKLGIDDEFELDVAHLRLGG